MSSESVTNVKGRLVRAGVWVAEHFEIQLDDAESKNLFKENPAQVVAHLLQQQGIKVNSVRVTQPINEKAREQVVHVVYPAAEHSNTIVVRG